MAEATLQLPTFFYVSTDLKATQAGTQAIFKIFTAMEQVK